MRRVRRVAVGSAAQTYLDQRQSAANNRLAANALDVNGEWKSARQTRTMGKVLATLQSMMGARERCMYCLDSHGCDIEHFRPKSSYPKWMFRWSNLLLCCSECGRIKGSQFPLSGRRHMLIDPTKEEPWDYLDFDPITGNMTARFDLQTNDFFIKGQRTVSTLQLDRREALAAGYAQTYRKLCSVINGFLNTPTQTAGDLIAALIREDEHGLLGWCFKGNGQNEAPFSQLKTRHSVWQACRAAFKYR
jgi:uncharacterized protein (TIGR02646 family)